MTNNPEPKNTKDSIRELFGAMQSMFSVVVEQLGDPDPLWTPEEVQAHFRWESVQTVYNKYSDGTIPGGVKIGSSLRFSRNVILAWQQDLIKKGKTA